MRFKMSLKCFSTMRIHKCGITPQLPRFVLICMNTFAIIMFSKTSVDVVGDADIPMFAIYGFKGINEVHGLSI